MFKDFLKTILKNTGLLDRFRGTLAYNNLAVLLNKNLRVQAAFDKKFYSAFIKVGDLCFDIGASLGGKTFIFKKIGANIVAAEPDQEAFSALVKKFGKSSKVILLNIGVGAKSGELFLNRSSNSTLSTFDDTDMESTLNDARFSNTRFYEKRSVKVETLDDLIAQFGIPEYCKISTVGFEVEVLKGLNKPISKISVTCNIPQHIEKTIECIDLIDKLGVYEYNYFLSTLLNGFVEDKWISGFEMKKRLEALKNKETPSRYLEVFAVQQTKAV